VSQLAFHPTNWNVAHPVRVAAFENLNLDLRPTNFENLNFRSIYDLEEFP